MIGRGLFVLTLLSNCVMSLPVTPSQLENEDVKVMECIVEALADVLSRPHPRLVSQECLVTLKTDDRLVSVLRHHNFLKELQEIAVQGGQGRAPLQRDAGAPEPTTQSPQTADGADDQSMLEALGGPGERSILSQKKRIGNGDGEEDKHASLRAGESQEDVAEEVQEKRGNDEKPGSHVSESVDEWSEGKAEKREEEEEEYEEKRVNSEEENMIKDKKGAGSGEKRNAPRFKTKEKKFDTEDEGETNKRSAFLSHGPKQEEEKQEEEEEEEEDEGEMKRKSSTESLKRWTKRGKLMPTKKAQQFTSEQKVPHHSKEVPEEEKKTKKRNTQRSQEEKELQMIAKRGPEERRVLEEEGSASRKSEEPEIESLAAIESELENVAQKLHEMRRG